MQLTDKEDKLYKMLSIISLNGKSLTWSKLVNDAYQLAEMLDVDENGIKKVINYYQERNGISKKDSSVLSENNDPCWFSHLLENGRTFYLNRYCEYLVQDKKMSQKVVESIKKDLVKICSKFADPKNPYVTNKKGIVVGDVQSGKTANYIGIINLAVDIGYKNIVLLTGTTENLRNQTQKRVDSGFIGAKSTTIAKQIEYIGVGSFEKQYFAITYTDEDKDFLKNVLDSIKTNETDLNKPRIFVIKKNKKVLTELKEYLEVNGKGRSDSSVLIIDDECDYASLNTRTKENRTAINGLIGEFFKLFKTTTYVGYTATPYANIFVDPNDTIDSIDLFPRDFIVLLEPPTDYVGGKKMFSKWYENDFEHEHKTSKTLYGPHIYLLSDKENHFLPTVHTIDDIPYGIPESLKLAICSFLISNCIRTLKGDRTEHRSMLINISRFNDVQEEIKRLVLDYVNDMKNAIEQTYMRKDLEKFLTSDITRMIYRVWSTDEVFYDKFGEDKEKGILPNRERFSWESIQTLLYEEIEKFEVAVANYRHKTDRYNYDNKKDVGARVIVIGGFSLSRGLTLEGLITSYYNRNATAYDVLLQMGRWFGYRPNYEELCMVFMTQLSVDSFRAAIIATEELKDSFREMADANKTPMEFGLAVRTSPESLETNLLVTARNKCKNATPYKRTINLSGKVVDTSKIYKDKEINEINTTAVKKLIEEAKMTGKLFVNSEADNDYKMLSGIDGDLIKKFISRIKFPLVNKSLDKDGISSIITKCPSLHKWDVVFAKGNRKEAFYYDFGIIHEKAVFRSFVSRKTETFVRIADTNNRLADPNLFRIGLTFEQYKTLSPDGKRQTLKAEEYLKFERNPLLIIYPIWIKSIDGEEKKYGTEDDSVEIENSYFQKPLIGIALGFPGKASETVETEYLYNKIKIEQILAEEGELDIDEDEDKYLEEEWNDEL